MTSALKPGTRVKFVQCVDVYPDAFVEVGETGTFVREDEDGAYWVTLDKHHEGLTEWSNQVQIWDNSDADHPEWKPRAHLEEIA
jgi:hypothetical protein